MPPGCSERERVNGAITTRCFNFNDPSCTGINSFRPFFLFIKSSRDPYLVGVSLEVREPGSNQFRFSDYVARKLKLTGLPGAPEAS
jgi:hypothetical protein